MLPLSNICGLAGRFVLMTLTNSYNCGPSPFIISAAVISLCFFFFYIFSALSSTSQFLISNLFLPEVFPNTHLIDVHLLDLGGDGEELQQLKNEVEHQALPLLREVK